MCKRSVLIDQLKVRMPNISRSAYSNQTRNQRWTPSILISRQRHQMCRGNTDTRFNRGPDKDQKRGEVESRGVDLGRIRTNQRALRRQRRKYSVILGTPVL